MGLVYHVVAPGVLPHIRYLYSYKHSVQFENDIAYLAMHYDLCRVRDVQSEGGRKPRAFISFDDGLAECYEIIRPILLKYGIPAAFFVTTGFIDNRNLCYRHKVSICLDAIDKKSELDRQRGLAHFGRTRLGFSLDRHEFERWIKSLGVTHLAVLDDACSFFGADVQEFLRTRRPYMTAEQLRRLACDGFDIGAHTVSHPKLSELSATDAEQEIANSCSTLAALLDIHHVPFAFPFSTEGLDLKWIKQLGERIPLLQLLFDTKQLACCDGQIFNRVCMDDPPNEGQRTNVPQILQTAYARECKRLVRSRLKRAVAWAVAEDYIGRGLQRRKLAK